MTAVDRIRVSIGTAIQLGLESGTPDPDFTTAFLMTYNEDGCTANCAFCPQARESSASPHMLSRIGWPSYELNDILENLADTDFKRVCIQSLNYEGVVDDICDITERVHAVTRSPISVCIHPVSEDDMTRFKNAGVQRIGIAFDACTSELFDLVKGTERNSSYTWVGHFKAIDAASAIFGVDQITTHLIIGLGETEREAIDFLFNMYERGIQVGLFAFTSIRGTPLQNVPQPPLDRYRRIQIIRYMLNEGNLSKDDVHYCGNGDARIKVQSLNFQKIVESGRAFRVSGCPGCNRPFYNERPTGPMFNYPRDLLDTEIRAAVEESSILDDC